MICAVGRQNNEKSGILKKTTKTQRQYFILAQSRRRRRGIAVFIIRCRHGVRRGTQRSLTQRLWNTLINAPLSANSAISATPRENKISHPPSSDGPNDQVNKFRLCCNKGTLFYINPKRHCMMMWAIKKVNPRRGFNKRRRGFINLRRRFNKHWRSFNFSPYLIGL